MVGLNRHSLRRMQNAEETLDSRKNGSRNEQQIAREEVKDDIEGSAVQILIRILEDEIE